MRRPWPIAYCCSTAKFKTTSRSDLTPSEACACGFRTCAKWPDQPRRHHQGTRQMTIFSRGACSCCEVPTDHGVTRRDTLDYLAKGGLAAFMAANGISTVRAQTDDVVRIGYLPITDATALLVAHAKGYFEEAGLKVEQPTLVRSWSALAEGFAAGKFNFVHL